MSYADDADSVAQGVYEVYKDGPDVTDLQYFAQGIPGPSRAKTKNNAALGVVDDGPDVPKPSPIAKQSASEIPEGIVYKRTDSNGKVEPYGGQARNQKRFIERQAEHARNYPESDFDFEIVARAQPGEALDIAEFNFIQELTGGVKARKSSHVSNKKDPVGPVRRSSLGLPEPRDF